VGFVIGLVFHYQFKGLAHTHGLVPNVGYQKDVVLIGRHDFGFPAQAVVIVLDILPSPFGN